MKTKKIVTKVAAKKTIAVKEKTAAKKKVAASKTNVVKKKTPVKKKVIAKPKPVVKKKKISNKIISTKAVSLSSSTNHIIPKSKGAEMVNKFGYNLNLNNLADISMSHGMEFDKSLFENLLALTGVATIRIYNAVNDNNEHTFVITAADKEQNDIYFKLNYEIAQTTKSNAEVASINEALIDDDGVGNMGTQCPAYTPDIIAL